MKTNHQQPPAQPTSNPGLLGRDNKFAQQYRRASNRLANPTTYPRFVLTRTLVSTRTTTDP
jgi:hypothetical protein